MSTKSPISFTWRNPNGKKGLAQAMVEFGLVLPILLLIMYGLIETGRLVFMYASVVSAARQAVRYGSVTGENDDGTPFYNDCTGIRNAAKRLGFLQQYQDSDILISYDNGPGSSPMTTSCPLTTSGHPVNGDRITVDVSTDFTPIVPLVPFEPFTIRSAGTRTLLVGVSVAVDVPGVTLTGSAGGAMSLFKDSNPPYFDQLGQQINYTYTISNLGAVPISGISMTDDKTGAVFCGAATDPLPGGDSTACTAVYVVTQADIDRGYITNIATATALSAGLPLVTQATLTINFIAKPEVTLTKVGTAPDQVGAGELIQYVFTLTNSGNVPINSPYSISDGTIGSNWTCAAAVSPLPVGQSTNCTGTYALKQADINAERVDNTATATAHYGTFSLTSNPASFTVLIPELYLQASASPSPISALGSTITYTYTVRNRSNKAMSNVVVTASRGPTNFQCTATLAAGAQTSCTRTYSGYTQTDMDSGYIINYVTAHADATAPPRTVGSNPVAATIPVTQTIQLTLQKTASVEQALNEGDPIVYSYAFTNTGNVTLTGPYGIVDDKISPIDCSLATGTLAPGTSKSCANATHNVTADDIAAGSLVNKAKATAKFGTQTVTSAEVSELVVTYAGARLGILKSATPTYFTATGQTLAYSFTLVNTGGQVLTSPYTIVDPLIPVVNCSAATSTIPVGGSTKCTGSYTVQFNNNTDGYVTNVATGTAMFGATPITATTPASLTVNKFVCTTTRIKHTDPTPIPSGQNIPWTIVNNSGIPLSINAITIGWSSPAVQLTQLQLGGTTIMSTPTNSNGGYVVPGAPWALPNGNTVLQLDFDATASNVRVVISVTGPSCNVTVDSGLSYPSGN